MSIENSNSHTEITADALIKRAFLSIEDGDFNEADGFLEQALNLDPDKADIYIGKLMIEKRVHNPDELSQLAVPLDNEKLFQRALRFADENEKLQLAEYANKNRLNREKVRREKLEKAKTLLKRVFIAIEDGDFDEAVFYLQPVLTQYPDNSDAYIAKLMINKKVHNPDELTQLATPLENEELFQVALRLADDDEKIKLNEYVRINNAEFERRYLKAIELKDRAETVEDFNGLIAELKAIMPYKDADAMLKEAIDKKELEEKYIQALEIKEHAKTLNDFKNLTAAFEALGNYKNSKALLDEIRTVCEKLKKAAVQTRNMCIASFLITAIMVGGAWNYYKLQKEKEIRKACAAAMNCYAQGDYEQAVKKYRIAAELGDANSQFWLGRLYQQGQGVKQDYQEAVKWYRKAADQGNSYAQNNLGRLYQQGRGVKQDYQEAAKWYRKAAEQGNSYAQNSLGWLYEYGRGVKQDYQEAAKWYRKSAEQGNKYGQYDLARMYEKGEGVKQDYQEAVKWYRKAAEQGDEDAKKLLNALEEKIKQKSSANAKPSLSSSKTSASSSSAKETQYEISFSELTSKLPPSLRSKGRLLITSTQCQIKGNNVRLCSAPTANSKVVAHMNNGYIVQALGLWQSDDGDWWEFIRTSDGKEGWVWGENIEEDYQNEPEPSQTPNRKKAAASTPVAGDPSDVQVNKLIAQNKIPLYIRDSGRFFYNPNMSMVRITGDNVRLRSQPNMNSNVIARGDREMWGSIDYLGEWTHPNDDKWVVGLYDGWNYYPNETPEWEKKVIWVSARFARPITLFEYRNWQNSIRRAD